MGNLMGNLKTVDGYWGLQDVPYDPDAKTYPRPMKITRDPMEGFPRGRKPRVAVATEEEMISAKIEPRRRDYCAHKLIDFKTCRYTKYPFVALCAPEKHEWEQCVYDDYIIRLKEVEREIRLQERDAARAAAAAGVAA
ncbi:NADH dehydrogenase [ubiquinone] 1 beta subcomplex subunit 7 [Galendromus occidentalis]|uniref:NADH dehydrogenase [ubiquinone] 1 beta subcomplex subunit 7 n=1 Tax=Galendromus occidentalis TaxID=34638 RepID=A0AAJ6VZ43_9ACAR|nr:NADH dehydrogenase [ubiquinone] 1 beta subcomplex subunit 7 [Galendromus occidentalis]